MNLVTDYINELGGYEVAKERSTPWLANHGENWRNVKEATLLEYRRQHNIFEVGDKVKAKDHQFGFDELFRIDDFFANDDGVNLAVLDDGDCYPISFLEHATDAEIKAGKRLEMT